MKKKIALSVMLSLCLLAGCATKSDVMTESSSSVPEYDMEVNDSEIYVEPEAEMPMEDAVVEETTVSKGEVAANRKIIERVYMDVETKEFDILIEKLTEEVTALGGYIESSSVSGNSYGYDDNRYAEFVFRIPTGKDQSFSAFVSNNGTVVNKRIETDDVTLSYIDMESRVKALETEKESLEKLLEASGSLEEIITVRSRLTDVIYEIESYQSQLRMYDNLIEYTTITVSVREVDRETIIEEQTAWEEIGTNLSDNLRNLKDGAVDLFIFFVSNIPFFVIIGGAAVIVIVVVKRVRRRRKSRGLEEK